MFECEIIFSKNGVQVLVVNYYLKAEIILKR